MFTNQIFQKYQYYTKAFLIENSMTEKKFLKRGKPIYVKEKYMMSFYTWVFAGGLSRRSNTGRRQWSNCMGIFIFLSEIIRSFVFLPTFHCSALHISGSESLLSGSTVSESSWKRWRAWVVCWASRFWFSFEFLQHH